MHRVLHAVTLRMTLIGAFYVCLAGIPRSALGQTNIEADIIQPETTLHNLAPVGGPVRLFFFSLAAALLVLVGVLTVLRYRVGPSLYKVASDAHWDADAQADVREQVDATEVLGACDALVHAGEPVEAPVPAKTELQPHPGRIFTPASGTAWGESMLKAFLNACMKVNCLARTWRESAARQVHSSSQSDPREAELIRRLMQRWPEFHVDPETGVFLEHSCATGKRRVCVISVTRDKHTLIQAAFNAGFVIESLGRYLKSTDLVYQRGPGDYHAPINQELATMTPGEKDSLIRVKDIPDPWQAMIGSKSLSPGRATRMVHSPAAIQHNSRSGERPAQEKNCSI